MEIYKSKLIIIGIMFFTFMIPLYMIASLVEERKERHNEALSEAGKAWGEPITFHGIMLSDGTKNYAPLQLKIQGFVSAEIRKRGIFKIPLYKSEMKIKAVFPDCVPSSMINKIILLSSHPRNCYVSDLKWSDHDIKVINSSFSSTSFIIPSIYFEFDPIMNKNDPADFSNSVELTLRLQGTESLMFRQVAKETSININSDWSNPSFTGTFLPLRRTISKDGFEAEWNQKNPLYVPNPTRYSLGLNESFGINFFVPLNIYSLTDRALKYSILFISLTFMCFFIFEMTLNIRIHPLQYLMVGSALVIFYLILLSFSEHISFMLSYIIASVSTISLISFYSAKIVNFSNAKIIAILLSAIYFGLYIILNLVDFSLLIGSVALFLILAIIMYSTRNIKWYDIE